MNILNFNKSNKNNNTYYYTSINIQSFIYKIYGWMSCGLLLTSLVSLYVSKNNYLLFFLNYNQSIVFLLIFFQFITIFCISNMLNKLNENIIISLFMFYSLLTGLNLSSIFILYTSIEIFISLFVTAIMFIFMTIYGYFTNTDLTHFKNLLLMLLFGIVISSLFNFYFESEYLMWIISYISIITFTGLIAHDTQKLKNLGNQLYYLNNNELYNKYSILGALILYLDFINLFLIPLRLFNKKNKN